MGGRVPGGLPVPLLLTLLPRGQILVRGQEPLPSAASLLSGSMITGTTATAVILFITPREKDIAERTRKFLETIRVSLDKTGFSRSLSASAQKTCPPRNTPYARQPPYR